MTRIASVLALAISLFSATAALAAPAQVPAAHKAAAQKPVAVQPVPQAVQADAPAQPRKVRVVLASPYVNTASN